VGTDTLTYIGPKLALLCANVSANLWTRGLDKIAEIPRTFEVVYLNKNLVALNFCQMV